MDAHLVEQGTDAWKRQRLGKATASRIADVIAKTKSGPSASRASYMAELILERITGQPRDFFQTPAMLHGIVTEPEAIDAYCRNQLCTAQETGFVDHPTIAMTGASPDRLVGGEGMVEAKCPQPPAHLDTLLKKQIPAKYVTQMAWQMACLPERKWCDFISYNADFPEHMQLIVIRLHRDDAMIAEIEAEVSKFLAEIDEKVAALREQYEPQREAA